MVITGVAVSLHGFYLSGILTLNLCFLSWEGSPSPNLLQLGSEYPHSWRFHGLSGGPVPVCNQSHGQKRVFWCSDGISRVCLCLIPSHQVLGHTDMIIPEPFLQAEHSLLSDCPHMKDAPVPSSSFGPLLDFLL